MLAYFIVPLPATFVFVQILSCSFDSSCANKQLMTVSLRPSVVWSVRCDNPWHDWEDLSAIWCVAWITSDSSSTIVSNDGPGRLLIYQYKILSGKYWMSIVKNKLTL